MPARDVPDYFLAADLVVLPYRHFTSQTGVGTIALPLGKPLIVTDVGGLSELVKDADCVVPPNDPTALAAAITKVLEEPGRLEALSEDSKQLVKDFEWDSIAEKVTNVYQQYVKPQRTVRAFHSPHRKASGNVEAPGS